MGYLVDLQIYLINILTRLVIFISEYEVICMYYVYKTKSRKEIVFLRDTFYNKLI